MGIIRKDKTENHVDTIIGCKTIFEGTILSNEGICIEGTVKGRIECKGNVVVGRGGKITADIIADNAFIAGQVDGNIKVKNRLEITTSGKLTGNIETSSLFIGDGVFFEGSCHMTGTRPHVGGSPGDVKDPLKDSSAEPISRNSQLSQARS